MCWPTTACLRRTTSRPASVCTRSGWTRRRLASARRPVGAGGYVYLASEDGDVFVVKAGRTFELVARNDMNESLMATPAVAGGMLIIRGRSHVFAIGDVARQPLRHEDTEDARRTLMVEIRPSLRRASTMTNPEDFVRSLCLLCLCG